MFKVLLVLHVSDIQCASAIMTCMFVFYLCLWMILYYKHTATLWLYFYVPFRCFFLTICLIDGAVIYGVALMWWIRCPPVEGSLQIWAIYMNAVLIYVFSLWPLMLLLTVCAQWLKAASANLFDLPWFETACGMCGFSPLPFWTVSPIGVRSFLSKWVLCFIYKGLILHLYISIYYTDVYFIIVDPWTLCLFHGIFLYWIFPLKGFVCFKIFFPLGLLYGM